MKKDNQSCLTEMVLLGFSDFRTIQELLFCLVLIFYFIALMGNSLVLILTVINSTLHTPMYFFLWNLSFVEISSTSSISPKMLVNALSDNQNISFWGCRCQMCFFILFSTTECCLLCVMAYDRYVSICKPLQYPYTMNLRECTMLVAASWTIGVFVGLGQSISIFTLPFCGSDRISHFFCDLMPVLRLVSTNTYKNEVAIAALTVLFILVPLLLILFSYILIISSIFTMPLAKNQNKAFSTCSSHLAVVCIFYGTGIVTYIRPIVTPSLNPIIYSLRNKEIKAAFMKSVTRNNHGVRKL
uniref:Olfactory receptor n=1 Tax=Laticauda laticaudata TaxID=8630 RepID=A0A8C5RTJ5_LATLA